MFELVAEHFTITHQIWGFYGFVTSQFLYRSLSLNASYPCLSFFLRGIQLESFHYSFVWVVLFVPHDVTMSPTLPSFPYWCYL